MRIRCFLVISLCLLISCSIVSIAKAQEVKQEERKIVTDGHAKIWIEPDRARVFLGIETMSEAVNLAREENATQIKNVLQALKDLKIKGMLIKAPSYNVSLVKEPEYDATRVGRLPKIIGYKVKQDFTVLLKSKDMLVLSKNAGQVIDTALDNGVNNIQDILFFKEDDSKDKRNAMAIALKDAISNAKTIADTAGVSIKDYSMINSVTHYWLPPRYSQMQQAFGAGAGGGVPTTIVAGKIAIASKVNLQCTIK